MMFFLDCEPENVSASSKIPAADQNERWLEHSRPLCSLCYVPAHPRAVDVHEPAGNSRAFARICQVQRALT